MDYSFTPPRGARGGGGGAGHRPRSGGGRRRQARDPYDAGVHQVSSAVELGSGGAGYGDSIGGRSDDDWLLEEAMLGGGGGRGAGRLGAHGSAEEALLPDSLTDPAGSSDWKDEMDPAAREQYRQLGKATQRPPLSRCCKLKQPLVCAGLVLYKATSQEQMAAAMVSLQQFERQHRSAAAARRKASEDSADDPDQAFRKMAMSEPENRLNRSAQGESSQRGLCVYTGFYKEEVGSLAQRGSGGKVSKELSQRRRGGGGVQVHTM